MTGGTIREAANLYRRVVFGTVTLLCLFPIAGEAAHTVGGLAVAGSLFLYLIQGLKTLRLTIPWHIGYLMIIALDGVRSADLIRIEVDALSYDEASRYITAANAAVLFVRSMLYDEREQKIEAYPEPESHTGAGVFLTTVYILFLVLEFPAALAFGQAGRVNSSDETFKGADAAILGGLLTSLGIFLPAAVTYYVKFSLKKKPIFGVLLSLPAIIVLYVTGIRYLVLMSAMGAFVLFLPVKQDRTVPFARLTILGSILLLLSGSMVAFRTEGLETLSLQSTYDYYTSNPGMHSEGVVVTLAKMTDYFRFHAPMLGRSSATLLVFWIPRQFWPNKPTFIDYWFIREYQGEQGINRAFSTGSSFASDALADFGLWGGVLYCAIFFGLLLAYLDRTMVRLLCRVGHPYSVVIAPLFGGALFAVRSFTTTVFQMTGVLTYGLIFALLFKRTNQRRTPLSGSNKQLSA